MPNAPAPQPEPPNWTPLFWRRLQAALAAQEAREMDAVMEARP